MKYQKTIGSFFGLLKDKDINFRIDLWENDISHSPYSKLVRKSELPESCRSSSDLFERLNLTIKGIYKRGNSWVALFQNDNKINQEEITYEGLNIGIF